MAWLKTGIGMVPVGTALDVKVEDARSVWLVLCELEAACKYLGFGLITTGPNGLERINRKAREQDRPHWAACVRVILGILEETRPRAFLLARK